jgi:hypothetical protein
MADCKPDRIVKRHGGEVWTCKCGTVGVTYAGVTVRYSARDFRRLSRLLRAAETELFGQATAAPAPAPVGGGDVVH